MIEWDGYDLFVPTLATAGVMNKMLDLLFAVLLLLNTLQLLRAAALAPDPWRRGDTVRAGGPGPQRLKAGTAVPPRAAARPGPADTERGRPVGGGRGAPRRRGRRGGVQWRRHGDIRDRFKKRFNPISGRRGGGGCFH